jgi:hypothetical protein
VARYDGSLKQVGGGGRSPVSRTAFGVASRYEKGFVPKEEASFIDFPGARSVAEEFFDLLVGHNFFLEGGACGLGSSAVRRGHTSEGSPPWRASVVATTKLSGQLPLPF